MCAAGSIAESGGGGAASTGHDCMGRLLCSTLTVMLGGDLDEWGLGAGRGTCDWELAGKRAYTEGQ